ncbi:MAG: substrate-binding domain-containing protein [Lachnospiraceae bacterium]|nr:substrate-binding domain-containing protein [Lachnospiraceae bacterium]
MKRKLMALLLVAAMTGALAACGSSSSSTESSSDAAEETEEAAEETTEAEEETASTEEILVAGVVYLDDQFQNLITQGYEDAAADAGEGVTLMTANTNSDQSTETDLINTYMTQGVQGLTIFPLNADASVATLKEAIDSGMLVALTDCTMDDVSFSIGAWTSDGYTNGYLAGTEAASFILDAHGTDTVKVAVVQFASLLPDQSASRVDGYLAALDDAGVNYEVVADQDAWLQDTALETADGIITANPDLDVILAMNDGGTIGSTQAVVAAGLEDQIMVFGHDGSDQISSMVLDDDSPLKAVVSQDPYTMGYNAMTALISTIRGEMDVPESGEANYIDGVVLSSADKDAVNSWRVEQGYEAIED